jgi:spore coat protein U-like protein
MKSNMSWFWKYVLSVSALILPLAVSAAGTVTCTAPSSAGIAFGDVTTALAGGSSINSTGTITVTCTRVTGNPNVDLTISLSAGGGGSGFSPRKMQSGIDRLSYNLYLDSARTLVWGDGTAGTQTYSVANINTNPSVTVNPTIYAQIPGLQQSTKVGNYSDTIVMTLNYI